MLLARPVSTINDKPQLVPFLFKARVSYIGNSPSNSVAPSLITYLFYAADEQNVHLQGGRTEIRCSPSSPILSLLTTSTTCSIPGMMIMDNLQAPLMAWQSHETAHFMARASFPNILLNGVRDGKQTGETGRPEAPSFEAGEKEEKKL